MALSPADFAAYSRATGTPYPEDPEERAALAPAVRDFRQSQLRQTQSTSDGGGLAGLAAVGLGALGALAAVKGLSRRKPSAGGRKGGVTLADLSDPRNAAVSQVAAQTSGPTDEATKRKQVYETVAKKPVSELPRVYKPQGGIEDTLSELELELGGASQLITDPNTGEIFPRGKSPSTFAQTYVAPLTNVEEQADVVDTLLNDPELKQLMTQQRRQEGAELGREAQRQMRVASAIESEADQYIAQLRQESLSQQTLGALESGEDQMTGRAMRGAQRNEDLDLAQINSVARQTGNADVALSMTSDGVPVDQVELLQPISAQNLANQAKEEMIARRQSLEAAGLRPGTVRFERALAQPFRTSSSQQVTGTQPIEFALPAGPVRRTVESVGVQEPLIERSVLNIGPQAVVTSTAAGTAIRGASPSYHEAMPKEPLRQLYGTADVLVPGAPNEVGPDLPGSLRVRGGVAPDVEPQLLSKQEIVYSFLDRPETLGPAGGSAGIGVYGLEPGFVPGAVSKATGEYSEAASRKPSYVPAWLQKQQSKTGFESLTTPQLAAGAEAAKAPGIKASFEQELAKRETTKQSLEVSEIVRRAIIEGRDPQTILRQRGFNV